MSESNDAPVKTSSPSEAQEPAKRGGAPNQSERLKQEALELNNRAEPFTNATQRAMWAIHDDDADAISGRRELTVLSPRQLSLKFAAQRTPREPDANDRFLNSDEIKKALAKAKADNDRTQPENAEYIRSLERLSSLTPEGLKAVAALNYDGGYDPKGITLDDARHLDNLEYTKKALATLTAKGTEATDKDFEKYLLDPETSPSLKLGMMEVRELLAQQRQRQTDHVFGLYTQAELSHLKNTLDAIKFRDKPEAK